MARRRIVIDSILGGISSSANLFSRGEYLNAIGIDPELPVDSNSDVDLTNLHISGVIRPVDSVVADSFSKTPLWMKTNPKDGRIYVYLDTGIVEYFDPSNNQTVGTATNITTLSNASGNGLAYYNNYMYFITDTDVARYGPLDGTPSMASGVWTGSTLGSQTALANPTYPTVRNAIDLPNHVAHVHTDNALYFADFVDGQGVLHKIKTKKVTDEGDTNDGSLYNVLDLPFGYRITAIETLDTALVIAATQTTDGDVNQGKSELFFWDAISDSFFNRVPVPGPYVTALKNANGLLYIWSGSVENRGYRLQVYAGGRTVRQIWFSADGYSPFPGAVESLGDKIFWGNVRSIYSDMSINGTIATSYYGVIMSYGSYSNKLPPGVHAIQKMSNEMDSSNGVVTCVLNALQAKLANPLMMAGWRDGLAYKIDVRSTSAEVDCVIQLPVVNVGRSFTIEKIRIPLSEGIASPDSIRPRVYTDNFANEHGSNANTSGLLTIDSNNFTQSEKVIELFPNIRGEQNFVLEFHWTSSSSQYNAIMLPIIIDIDEDEIL